MRRALVAAVLSVAGLCLLVVENHKKGGRSELLDKGFRSFEMSARRGVRAKMSEAPEEEDKWRNNLKHHDGEVKIDDSPTGWIGVPSVVGNREVHVQQARDGGIDRIDVPSDAVVERSADGWTIEIPHERARDADDGYKWLPRGNTLNRRNMSEKEWARKRLLDKFKRFERQSDTHQNTDDIDDGGVADMNVHETHIGSAPRPEARADCDHLDCLLRRIRDSVRRRHAVVRVDVRDQNDEGESKQGQSEQEPCKIACLIRSIVKASDGASEERQQASTGVTEKKIAEAADAPRLPFSNRPTSHAIVDVYAPYEDPYYCQDGSSSAECGTGEDSKVRVHDYTLGWTPDDGSRLPPAPGAGVDHRHEAELHQRMLKVVMRDLVKILEHGGAEEHGNGEHSFERGDRRQKEDAEATDRAFSKYASEGEDVDRRQGGKVEGNSAADVPEAKRILAEPRLRSKNVELAGEVGRDSEKADASMQERNTQKLSEGGHALHERRAESGLGRWRHAEGRNIARIHGDRHAVEEALSGGDSRSTQKMFAQWMQDVQLNDAAKRRSEAESRIREERDATKLADPGSQKLGETDAASRRHKESWNRDEAESHVQRQQLSSMHEGARSSAQSGDSQTDDLVLKGVGKWLGAYERHRTQSKLSEMRNMPTTTVNSTVHALGGDAAASQHAAELKADEWEDQYQHVQGVHGGARMMQLADASSGRDFFGSEQKSMHSTLQREDSAVGDGGEGEHDVARRAGGSLLERAALHSDSDGRESAVHRQLVHVSVLMRMKEHSEEARRHNQEEKAQGGGSFGWLWGK